MLPLITFLLASPSGWLPEAALVGNSDNRRAGIPEPEGKISVLQGH